MAVAFDSSGTPFTGSGGATATTLSLTTLTVGSGENRVLLGYLASHGDPGAITEFSWNGVALSSVMTINNGGALYVFLYRLIAPASGTLTLTATWTTAHEATLGAADFSGVDQTTPIVVADNQSPIGTSTTALATIPSASSDATVAFDGEIQIQSADTQTRIWMDNVQVIGTAGSYALGGTSNAHQWTITPSAEWAVLGVHLQAAAGGGDGSILWAQSML